MCHMRYFSSSELTHAAVAAASVSVATTTTPTVLSTVKTIEHEILPIQKEYWCWHVFTGDIEREKNAFEIQEARSTVVVSVFRAAKHRMHFEA